MLLLCIPKLVLVRFSISLLKILATIKPLLVIGSDHWRQACCGCPKSPNDPWKEITWNNSTQWQTRPSSHTFQKSKKIYSSDAFNLAGEGGCSPHITCKLTLKTNRWDRLCGTIPRARHIYIDWCAFPPALHLLEGFPLLLSIPAFSP